MDVAPRPVAPPSPKRFRTVSPTPGRHHPQAGLGFETGEDEDAGESNDDVFDQALRGFDAPDQDHAPFAS